MVMEHAILGYPSNKILNELRSKNLKVERYSFKGTHIGNNAVIRSNSIIYCDVKIGDNLRTGHNVMVREMTYAGDNVLIGTNSIVDGYTVIGNNISIQGNVYIPTNTIIEDNVFFGPCSAVTNDKYPIRVRYDLKGAIIRKGVTIGANATILPGVEIGEGAMVGAGALVTKDVPAWMLAIGSPAKTMELPEHLRHYNRI
jgi:acetyltransferase-like isoleucine patch superfamily enzyme